MKKILVIEDNLDILEIISELLELSGYTAYTASNGKEGILQALAHQPDLIVCDISMPEMNGFEVLLHLQSDPTIKHTPFIFLSAKADKEDFRKGMSLGADDYITKPFEGDELLNAISKRLEKAEELKAQQEEKNSLKVRSLKATHTKERQKLSTELRDHIGQVLTSCKLMMEVASEGGDVAQHFSQKCAANLNQIIKDLQNICEQLSKPHPKGES